GTCSWSGTLRLGQSPACGARAGTAIAKVSRARAALRNNVTIRLALGARGLRLRAPAQPLQQLRRRPGIRRLAELDLDVADCRSALEAEHTVDAADVVAAPLQELLQL